MIGMSFREHPAGSAATTRVGVYRVLGVEVQPLFSRQKTIRHMVYGGGFIGFMVQGSGVRKF